MLPPVYHIALQVAVSLVLSFGVVFILVILTGDPNIEEYNILGEVFGPAIYLSGALSILLFSLLYIRTKKDFIPLPRSKSTVMPIVVVMFIAANFAVSAGIQAVQNMLETDLPTNAMTDFEASPMSLMGLLLFVFIAAPVAEELCFRGLMQNQLCRRFPFWAANLIQGAIFGAIHRIPIQVGYAFALGLFLGWLYQRTGRLSVVIVAHIVFNCTPILMGFLALFAPGYTQLMGSTAPLALKVFLPASVVFFAGWIVLGKKLQPTEEI